MGKYLKKSCSYYECEQCFFKYFPKYFVSYSRSRYQNSKMATLGLNELIVILAIHIFHTDVIIFNGTLFKFFDE
jgi:hypothetical protein